jgi:hypothetical protein
MGQYARRSSAMRKQFVDLQAAIHTVASEVCRLGDRQLRRPVSQFEISGGLEAASRIVGHV